MVIQLSAFNETMSTGSMDITESFRPDDITKTDFFDFVTAPDSNGIGNHDRVASDANSSNLDAPLQGFDQFWGAEKDTSRLESTIFEDLNRYCWAQANNSSDLSSQTCNTDGQIYTLTVLNGNEPWLLQQQEPNSIQRKICDTPDDTSTPALDFDSLLNTFPGFIKTEYTYDDSGFSTDNKDDNILSSVTSSTTQQSEVSASQSHQQSLQQQQQNQPSMQQQQHQQQHISVTNSTNLNNSLTAAFHNNNNNDWQMADHNIIVDVDGSETPESLLRSALQGKGYAKRMQNCISVIPSISSIKRDGDLRHVIFTNDAQTTLTFADSTLSAPVLFDEGHSGVQSTNSSLPTSNQSDANDNDGVIVDDMFLTLDASSFVDDFEKIKRIASDVQQFCITSDEFSEIITEVAIQSPTNAIVATANTPLPQQDVVTTSNHLLISSRPSTITTNTMTKAQKTTKKYKRSPSHTNLINNNSITMTNNNSTSGSSNNLNHSVTVVNAQQQRKERSLHYCSICSKGFKDKYSVNVHHRTHTGEKPFACSLCGKSFRQKAHLAKHYQTHLAQKNAITAKGGSKQQQQQQQSQQKQQNNRLQSIHPHNIASSNDLTNGTDIMR